MAHRIQTQAVAKRISIASCLIMANVFAAQTDIPAPAGSNSFGAHVAVLPNGNIVVVDPDADVTGVGTGAGAVYLYNPGKTLISTLTGASAGDHIGTGGIFVVGAGNFVVSSPQFNDPAHAQTAIGASTWIDAAQGLSGRVSAANSLVGFIGGDHVGATVSVLRSGDYVVISPDWSSARGAVTFARGDSAIHDSVGSGNSLVGVNASDQVGSGGIVELSNGNFVVSSPYWNSTAGAVTWCDGGGATAGPVGIANSLVGSASTDQVGAIALQTSGVTSLANGNYVVASPLWNRRTGAVTWGNGSTGSVGTVSAANSLVGSSMNDCVGDMRAVAVGSGNYVVLSAHWFSQGAVTWGDGNVGTSGLVQSNNSLTDAASVGGTCGGAGFTPYMFALSVSGGGFVVASATALSGRGAARRLDGNASVTGFFDQDAWQGGVSGDYTGAGGAALQNGNYVITSPTWNGGRGAVTWADGSTSLVAATTVAANNSLTGANANDQIGYAGVAALSNGNYVVGSPNFNGGAGAATWSSGTAPASGTVSAANSLVGSASDDMVGASVMPLNNGNYVVVSYRGNLGAVTWANGSKAHSASMSAQNSLYGTHAGDALGSGGIEALADGNYLIASPYWNGGAGAITLAGAGFRLVGTVQAWNSVTGINTVNGGIRMVHAYDAVRHRVVVGRPADNVVSIFSAEQIFADNFEP